MASFTAYYDTSGNQNDKDGALVTVGLVALDRKWERFDKEWNEVLASYDVTSLHMRKLVGCVGQFESWKGNEDKRSAFIEDLIRVIKHGINKGFSMGLFMKDFHKVNEVYTLSELYSAGRNDSGGYALCASTCFGAVGRWVRKNYPHATVSHVIEKGDTGSKSFSAFVVREMGNKVDPVTYSGKVDETGRAIRQFEAADLIAWEHRHFYKFKTENIPYRVRQSLNQVEKHLPLDWRYQEAEGLTLLCQSLNVPLRHPK